MNVIQKLFGEKVLVELVEEKKDSSKLYVPKENDVLFGKVLILGDTAKRVQKNDIIVFPTNSKSLIEIEERQYFIVRENDIHGIVNNV
jgi:co-chaperonin GroES (HSP10)